MYLIYKHTNTISGKSYIGQTKNSMEYRWKGHLRDTNRKGSHQYHFLRALRKYPKDSWVHEVLEEGIPKNLVNVREKHWINHYDTFNNGYNSTLGGDNIFPEANPRKGSDCYNFNNNTYTFFHKDGKKRTCTIQELVDEFSLVRNFITQIVNGNSKSSYGWATNEWPKKTIKRVPPKRGSEEYIEQCRKRMLGEKNPIFGTKRPDNVKQAISVMRKASADQKRRTWVHAEHGTEEEVTSVELRDKYDLNISHLKKITDGVPRYKSHKGWKLKCGNK